ncbi:kelch-like protein 1 [Oppia nitens]|uniref:kelch-like protein 1 n=1 Tax=Oppia nitens TaxID=1686743 RepID=UPI0023DBA28C|nr:kelch-like protein 1 [Oppia nitens]
MSIKRMSFSLISMDSKLYAIGGWNGNYLNSIETYDQQTNQWKSIASMNIIRRFIKFYKVIMMLQLIQNHIYVCGGENGNVINFCEYYSLNTNHWSIGQPMSTENHGMAVIADNGFIYTIGGQNKNGGNYLNSIERYDTITQQWQPMANMRYTRCYFGSASFMDKIYVCGGWGNSNCQSCEAYDPKTNQWTQIGCINDIR